MRCQDAQELITGLVDNELSSEERLSIDGHLKECPKCALIYEHERVLKRHIHSAGVSVGVPVDLRAKILAAASENFPGAAANEGPLRVFGWLAMPSLKAAFVGAALVTLVVALFYFWLPRQNVSLSALETHQKILAGRIIIARADNRAELVQMMIQAVAGKFAPMGYDLSMMKLRPVGGLVQEIGDRKLLVSSYQGGGPAITCFTFLGTDKDAPPDAEVFFDAEKKMNFYAFFRDGVNAVLHREGEVICILVSKMPMPDLLAIAREKARHA